MQRICDNAYYIICCYYTTNKFISICARGYQQFKYIYKIRLYIVYVLLQFLLFYSFAYKNTLCIYIRMVYISSKHSRQSKVAARAGTCCSP